MGLDALWSQNETLCVITGFNRNDSVCIQMTGIMLKLLRGDIKQITIIKSVFTSKGLDCHSSLKSVHQVRLHRGSAA